MGKNMYFGAGKTGDQSHPPNRLSSADIFRGKWAEYVRSGGARPAPRIPSWFPGNWSSRRRGTRTCPPPAKSREGVYEPGPPFRTASNKARWLQTGRRTMGASRVDSNVLDVGLASGSLGSDDFDVHVHGISLGISPHLRLDDLILRLTGQRARVTPDAPAKIDHHCISFFAIPFLFFLIA